MWSYYIFNACYICSVIHFSLLYLLVYVPLKKKKILPEFCQFCFSPRTFDLIESLYIVYVFYFVTPVCMIFFPLLFLGYFSNFLHWVSVTSQSQVCGIVLYFQFQILLNIMTFLACESYQSFSFNFHSWNFSGYILVIVCLTLLHCGQRLMPFSETHCACMVGFYS